LTAETGYYYSVTAENADGATLSRYDGTFTTGSAGVEEVATDTPSVVGYYNAQGIKAAEPWPGLNIVVYSDGTTRKTLHR